MPVVVTVCEVMEVALGVVDHTRVSCDLADRLPYLFQTAESLPVIPGLDERIPRGSNSPLMPAAIASR